MGMARSRIIPFLDGIEWGYVILNYLKWFGISFLAINGNILLIDCIDRFINNITRLLNGITRPTDGSGGRPGPGGPGATGRH